MGKAKILDWRKAAPGPILLISGPETFTADRVIRSIRDQLKAQDAGLEVHQLQAADYTTGLLESLASPSLFQEPRLIIIDSAERCTDEFIEEGIKYIEQPSPETTLVIRHNSSSVRGKKLLETIRTSDLATEIICSEIKKDSDRIAFIQAEFENSNRKITAGAIRAISEAFVDDLSELAAACAQLISDASDTIDEKLVESYYGGRVETNAFKVADAAFSGRAADALALLRHALATGSDPVPMVAAFAMKVRLMAKVYGNKYASPANLGAQQWQIDRAKRDLSGWSEQGLAEAVMAVAVADAAVKGMERDPVFALERLVLLLSNRGEKNAEAN